MAAPPEVRGVAVAAVAVALPSRSMAMRTDADVAARTDAFALRAIRLMSRYDKHNPFSFCAYGVS
jgi:hypothetical protein